MKTRKFPHAKKDTLKPFHPFISVLFITLLGIMPFLRPGTCEAASTTVAVLPFENLNRDSTYEVLSRGMCESLITGLSSVQSLTLVERGQVEKALREQALGLTGAVDEKTAPKTGQMLGAKYVVMGSYQVLGNQVKITARFVNVETGEIDPSKTVTVTGKYPDEIFDLQAQIASQLVTSFNVAATKTETDKMAAVLKSPGNYTAYELFMKGRNAWLLGTEKGYQEAAAYFRKGIELNPAYADAYKGLGVALDEQGKYEEAIVAHRKAIELNPTNGEAYNNLGAAFNGQGKYQDAVAAFRKAIEIQPAYALAYYNLGTALNNQKGKAGEAATALRKAIELKPDDADAYTNLGVALDNQKKTGEAIEAYRKAIELDPAHAVAYVNLGLALRKQKKDGEAIVAYRKAIELKPDYARALEFLAVLLDSKNMRQEARQYWQQAFKIEKDPTWINLIMRRLAQRD
jgi:tetratricopeptide (TPR) repeat protein